MMLKEDDCVLASIWIKVYLISKFLQSNKLLQIIVKTTYVRIIFKNIRQLSVWDVI